MNEVSSCDKKCLTARPEGLVVRLLLCVSVCVLVLVAGVCAQDGGALQIYFVDVEGGQATLFVTPEKESLLIDTGWPGNESRDADRIVAAAKRRESARSITSSSRTSMRIMLAEHPNLLPKLLSEHLSIMEKIARVPIRPPFRSGRRTSNF